MDSINILRGKNQTHHASDIALTVLTSANKTPKSPLFENNNRHYIKLIRDIPLAFTSLEKHQSTDPECMRIINSIANDTNKQAYILKMMYYCIKKQTS